MLADDPFARCAVPVYQYFLGMTGRADVGDLIEKGHRQRAIAAAGETPRKRVAPRFGLARLPAEPFEAVSY